MLISFICFVMGLIFGWVLFACVIVTLYYCGEILIDDTGDRDKYRFNMEKLPGKYRYSLFKNIKTELDDSPSIPQ